MNRIKELRKKLNKSQWDFAKDFNICRTTLAKWEKGIHNPDYNTVIKLADYFNVSTDYLMGHDYYPVVEEQIGFVHEIIPQIQDVLITNGVICEGKPMTSAQQAIVLDYINSNATFLKKMLGDSK